MKMKKLGLAVGLLVSASSGFGESYQFEVGGTYSQTEVGYGFGGADLDTISLRGKVHFSKLVTSGQPKAEESFLAQSNNFSLIHSMTDGDVDTILDLARLEFYVPSAMLYVAPFYLYSAIRDDRDESDNTYGLSLGLTPIEGLRVFTTWVDEFDYEINLQSKYVKELGNGTAMNIELGYEKKSGDSKYNDYIGAAFDFYFDPSLSIGAFYDSSAGINKFIIDTNFNVGEDSYGVRASKYVNDSIGLYGSYATSDDIDSLNIGLNCRF